NTDWQRPEHILPDDLLENVRPLRILVPTNQSPERSALLAHRSVSTIGHPVAPGAMLVRLSRQRSGTTNHGRYPLQHSLPKVFLEHHFRNRVRDKHYHRLLGSQRQSTCEQIIEPP